MKEISHYSLNTDTNCNKYISIETPVFDGFLKIIDVQNQLAIVFCPNKKLYEYFLP